METSKPEKVISCNNQIIISLNYQDNILKRIYIRIKLTKLFIFYYLYGKQQKRS